MNIVLICVPVLFLVASVFMAIKAFKKGKSAHRTIATQIAAFAIVCVVTFGIPMAVSAATNDAAATNSTTTSQAAAAADSGKGLGLLAAAIAVSVSGIAGGIAVAAAAPAAIGATSEDPKNFGKAIIFVALAEGIALYGLLASILIINKF